MTWCSKKIYWPRAIFNIPGPPCSWCISYILIIRIYVSQLAGASNEVNLTRNWYFSNSSSRSPQFNIMMLAGLWHNLFRGSGGSISTHGRTSSDGGVYITEINEEKNNIKDTGGACWGSSSSHTRIPTMVPTTLLTTLLLAFFVAAKPIIRAESLVKLPITRRVNFATGSNIVRQDQQRTETLKAKGHAIEALQSLAVSNSTSSPVENEGVFYIASVGVGSPATQCKWLQQLVAGLENF